MCKIAHSVQLEAIRHTFFVCLEEKMVNDALLMRHISRLVCTGRFAVSSNTRLASGNISFWFKVEINGHS